MRRPFRAAAQRFLVWRYGSAADWNCTYLEIARATGIDPKTVSLICRKHGYEIEPDRVARQFSVIPVDNFISLNSPQLRNRY
ncbi:hypothetical protein NKJ23_16075 [Mesorhizobium sp. M0184]|uniref:hypothetical protein n=1 Tax=Mesorhizobium sp. M0184 TaxID=2956906 RepID=UPI00333C7A31